MNISRSLLASAFVTATAVVLAGSPAHAGGDPGYEIGTITVDHTATVDDDLATIGGSYTCSGAGDRIGSLSFQLLLREGAPTDLQTVDGLTCDGASHRWDTVTAVGAGRVPSGAATFWGGITVCETPDGPCPMTLVEARVILKRAR